MLQLEIFTAKGPGKIASAADAVLFPEAGRSEEELVGAIVKTVQWRKRVFEQVEDVLSL